MQLGQYNPLQPTDSLPGQSLLDLSMAASVIPKALFEPIAQYITQVDLSLFGMRNTFDPGTASIGPLEHSGHMASHPTDFSFDASPISSMQAGGETFAVPPADFA
ncbi:hypothetical protein [Limnobacter sp.]|uniref:hypothetical protein n=1 Tax=Limnobacter sp. TaxID=2003368 RepID=UPI003510D69C